MSPLDKSMEDLVGDMAEEMGVDSYEDFIKTCEEDTKSNEEVTSAEIQYATNEDFDKMTVEQLKVIKKILTNKNSRSLKEKLRWMLSLFEEEYEEALASLNLELLWRRSIKDFKSKNAFIKSFDALKNKGESNDGKQSGGIQ